MKDGTVVNDVVGPVRGSRLCTAPHCALHALAQPQPDPPNKWVYKQELLLTEVENDPSSHAPSSSAGAVAD
jgi:hypothetical protein